MAREILIDADGVVVAGRHKYFSQRYSEEHGVSVDDIMTFFKGPYKDAALGKVDIREALPPYLEKWGWEGTVDEFLSYWFEGERDVDNRVLEVVRGLRQSGSHVYLASDNEARRAEYLMTQVGFAQEFDGGFFSSQLGVTKSDPAFFEHISKQLGVSLTDLEYWDDDPKNVEVANTVGVRAHTYENFEDFKEKVGK